MLHGSYAILFHFLHHMVVQSATSIFLACNFIKGLNIPGIRERNGFQEHKLHICNIFMKLSHPKQASRKHEIEKLYGAWYTELLCLPYFDNIAYHVVDPMHNMCWELQST